MKIGTKIRAISDMGSTYKGVVSKGAFTLREEHIWVTIETDAGPLEVWFDRSRIKKTSINLYKHVLNE